MRILIVGGAHQGKLAYAREQYGFSKADSSGDPWEIDQLHSKIREIMDAGSDPYRWIYSRLDEDKQWIVLCDEVGCGVVPIDRKDREWREAVGRICCDIARQADIVERVVCGIPQRIKGK